VLKYRRACQTDGEKFAAPARGLKPDKPAARGAELHSSKLLVFNPANGAWSGDFEITFSCRLILGGGAGKWFPGLDAAGRNNWSWQKFKATLVSANPVLQDHNSSNKTD
jgi:hypothetical protein